jgi:hypothetical protein
MMSGSDTFSMISELSRLKALLEFKVFEIDRAIYYTFSGLYAPYNRTHCRKVTAHDPPSVSRDK